MEGGEIRQRRISQNAQIRRVILALRVHEVRRTGSAVETVVGWFVFGCV